MNIKITMAVILVALLTACGKKEDVPPPPPVAPQSEVAPAVEPATAMTPVPAAVESPGPVVAAPPQDTTVTLEQAVEKPVTPRPESMAPVPQEPATKVVAVETQAGALSRDDALALASKSGCLACHSVEKKVVGPAWQDVGARYKGDASVKAKLIDKVKKGGKGNWTEVTNGVPMPPYSPRVTDADIEKLVSFVLSLG